MRINVFLLVLLTILIYSCKDDDPVINEPEPIPVEDFVIEAFPDISISTLEQVETPYEQYFETLVNGRTLSNHVSINDISSELENIFPNAKVLNAQDREDRGLATWRLQLKMPGQGILKAVVSQDLAEIIKLEGLSGPYDYVVDPGGSFISLAEAFQAAFEVQDGKVKRWELELEEEDRWEYEIHINDAEGGSWEIEIDAFTGDLISKKLKGEGEGEIEDEMPAPDEIINIVTTLTEGDVLHSEEGDDGSWEVFIESDGGVIEVVLDSNGELIEASGKGPSFNYEFDPGNGLLTFSQALQIALDFLPGTLDRWNLELEVEDDPSLPMWVYTFRIIDGDGNITKVRVDATTGELIFQGNEVTLPENISVFIGQLVSGEIITWNEQEDIPNTWKITIRMPNGGLLEIQVEVTGDVVMLLSSEGKTAPFDYEFTPPNNLLTLSTAIQTALSNTQGEVMRWSLIEQLGDDGINLWVYEVRVRPPNDPVTTVQLDALSGQIIENESEGPPSNSIPQEIIDIAASFTTGTVVDFMEKSIDGIDVLQLTIDNSPGTLALVVNATTNDFISATGQTGPFDYDFNPGNDLIVFSAARSIVSAAENGSIINWSLSFDDKQLNRWVYEFTITGAGKKVVDASTGEIL